MFALPGKAVATVFYAARHMCVCEGVGVYYVGICVCVCVRRLFVAFYDRSYWPFECS